MTIARENVNLGASHTGHETDRTGREAEESAGLWAACSGREAEEIVCLGATCSGRETEGIGREAEEIVCLGATTLRAAAVRPKEPAVGLRKSLALGLRATVVRPKKSLALGLRAAVVRP